MAFFLFVLGLFIQAKAQTSLVPPLDAKEYLHHDKHGMLVIGNPDQDKAWLVTRHATSERNLNLTPQNWGMFRLLNQHITGDTTFKKTDVFAWFYYAHSKLIAPFQPAIDELNQLTVVPCEELRRIPFEAFVPSLLDAPSFHFLGETHTISYLMDFSFSKQHTNNKPIVLKYDSTATFWQPPFPFSETHIVTRSNRGPFFPPGVQKRFLILIDEGMHTNEALSLARKEYLAKFQTREFKTPPMEMDPRHWAQAMVYGETKPIYPAQEFPWWILVPIGLVLVIVFGKRL